MNIGDVFYEKHTVEALSERTGEPLITKCENVNVIEISDGMTKGDVIKAVFPNAKVEVGQLAAIVDFGNQETDAFLIDWWDAPYKREEEE